MEKNEIKDFLVNCIPEMEEIETWDEDNYKSVYLGSFMALDPCGPAEDTIISCRLMVWKKMIGVLRFGKT
jgi:hypothetical protein